MLSGRRAAAPLLALLIAAAPATAGARGADVERYRAWIDEMKQAPRGPFRRIRWFCADGSVLPPKPYACKDRGGGVQHGELDARARELRANGYHVANVLADLDAQAFLAREDHRDALAQILIEQFLIRIDDGWILRRARFYRGALQEQDERRGARELLLALAGSDAHLARDFTLLRSAARLLPHGADERSAGEVRQLSAALSDRDRGFLDLRNKIHARPQPSDAQAVRAYARERAAAALVPDLERLAAAIDALFAASPAAEALRALARGQPDAGPLAALAAEYAGQLGPDAEPVARFEALAAALAALRDALPAIGGAKTRLAAIDASLALESDLFVAAAALAGRLDGASRATRTAWLAAAAEAAYGAGLVSARQREALAASAQALAAARVPLERYKRELDYAALLPGWGTQRLRFHFGEAMSALGEIEPKAARFIEDQLRGSPLLFHAQVLDGLLRDANRLAGVRKELFGENVGAGLRGLNPGLARGRLLPAPEPGEELRDDSIYVLPETAADLPPVAGILTAGEGNPLSHVQLLARNLGIPNVGVDEALLPALAPHYGREVLLAVSAAGSVRLAADGAQIEARAARQDDEPQVLIRPDLGKLDLEEQRLLALSTLRAEDSGRSVGPKAAKLGELARQFPEAVEEGLAIPFGVFRSMLDARREPGGQTLFQWMQAGYRRLESMPRGSAGRRAASEALRAELHARVLAADPGEAFRERLRRRMAQVFGADGSYGVFVRSDTNVEDLPGFTGAGLNLTVPNVVGVDAVLEALPRVWASPFTARAFAWRQAHMESPEHVYPAILLLRSVDADKSGVMVTRDIDSGAEGWLSVAVNEGVGGAVDGQAAESLRIHVASGEVRLLAQATAPWKRELDPAGGVRKVPASGRDRVLGRDEIRKLIELHEVLPQRFPAIVDDQGRAAPADIEFGFVDGALALFQIRPFLESRRARGNAYLASLDADLQRQSQLEVDMHEVP